MLKSLQKKTSIDINHEGNIYTLGRVIRSRRNVDGNVNRIFNGRIWFGFEVLKVALSIVFMFFWIIHSSMIGFFRHNLVLHSSSFSTKMICYYYSYFRLLSNLKGLLSHSELWMVIGMTFLRRGWRFNPHPSVPAVVVLKKIGRSFEISLLGHPFLS